MKTALSVAGLLMALAGIVFFLQGTNVLPVGGMAGQSMWTVIGAIMAVLGIGLVVWARRR